MRDAASPLSAAQGPVFRSLVRAQPPRRPGAGRGSLILRVYEQRFTLERRPRRSNACRNCGAKLTIRKRVYCDRCFPDQNGKHSAAP